MKQRFVWSDAWMLLAIIYSGERKGQLVDLVSIIQAADFINHAIPTKAEIDGALNRLKQAHFIEEEDGKFKASTSTTEAYASTTTPRKNVSKELEDFTLLLNISTR